MRTPPAAPAPTLTKFIERARELIERFRALGGVPELCDIAWRLCLENEELKRAALASPPSGATWQPIESAPKDDGWFLARRVPVTFTSCAE